MAAPKAGDVLTLRNGSNNVSKKKVTVLSEEGICRRFKAMDRKGKVFDMFMTMDSEGIWLMESDDSRSGGV